MSKRDMKTALRTVSRAETSDRFDVTAAQMVSVRERSGLLDIPLEQVQPNPDQPRRQFDLAALEELAASLQAVGVLQPILVRRQGERGYVIVAGERRWRAAQLAGLATIPAIVRAFDDNATLEAALTENLQREDLTPLEEAHLFLRMVDELGYSIRRLADRLGKGKGYIEDRLRLTRMDADLQALVSGRPDTLTHAREIEKVADPAERATLIAQVRENMLPLQEVRRRIREAAAPVGFSPGDEQRRRCHAAGQAGGAEPRCLDVQTPPRKKRRPKAQTRRSAFPGTRRTPPKQRCCRWPANCAITSWSRRQQMRPWSLPWLRNCAR